MVADNPILLDDCDAQESEKIQVACDALIDAGEGMDVNTLINAYTENLAHLLATISEDPGHLSRNIYRATHTLREGTKAVYAEGTDRFRVERAN